MQISAPIPTITTLYGGTHDRVIGEGRYRFWHYRAHGVRLVAAARWDEAAKAWLPVHRFHSYAEADGKHARCERRVCEDCDGDGDECEVRFRDEYDAVLCGDCLSGRQTADEDAAAWRSHAYR
jgi:hypothetical protein